MEATKRALRILARRIQSLDAEIKELMNDLDTLTQSACPGRSPVQGLDMVCGRPRDTTSSAWWVSRPKMGRVGATAMGLKLSPNLS